MLLELQKQNNFPTRAEECESISVDDWNLSVKCSKNGFIFIELKNFHIHYQQTEYWLSIFVYFSSHFIYFDWIKLQ